MQPDLREIDRIISVSLTEDIGRGDITTQSTIPADATGSFAFIAREPVVVCGIPIVHQLIQKTGGKVTIIPHIRDGAAVEDNTRLITLKGDVRTILTVERVALNLFQHSCGIATLTQKFVQAVKGTHVAILDTRKTTPGLREIEKYAVRTGGGRNHRMRLDDGVLIKDNHISVCGGITQAVTASRTATPVSTRIEVECDTVAQAEEALNAGADMLLLDNMSPAMLREVVAMNTRQIPLEASGGVTLETVRGIAETGVQFISIGALTHSAPNSDIGLDSVPDTPAAIVPDTRDVA